MNEMYHPTFKVSILFLDRPTKKEIKRFCLMSWQFVFTVVFVCLKNPLSTDAFIVSSTPSKTIYSGGRSRSTMLKTAEIDFSETTLTIARAIKQGPLQDYAPAALSLFNNMKLPAGVITAGMISIGFATRFPQLPKDTPDKVFSEDVRRRCDQLDRLHIVVALISVTSELIVVLWSAVEVNQLTERTFAPATSVWDLIQRDCDLPWSGINSHFILGIIGFVTMLALRAYVMLLAANASRSLMISASTGTLAALCLCVSIVNRGVESGGGGVNRYGSTIIDLIIHYANLLLKAGLGLIQEASPGPLQLSAFGLEILSLIFLFAVLVGESGTESCEENTKIDESSDLSSINTIVIDDNKEDPSVMKEEKQEQLDDSDGGASVAVF